MNIWSLIPYERQKRTLSPIMIENLNSLWKSVTYLMTSLFCDRIKLTHCVILDLISCYDFRMKMSSNYSFANSYSRRKLMYRMGRRNMMSIDSITFN
jgi:hypothetical protein